MRQKTEDHILEHLAAYVNGHNSVCRIPRCRQPVELVAWLLHKMAIKSSQLGPIQDAMRRMEADCPDCDMRPCSMDRK